MEGLGRNAWTLIFYGYEKRGFIMGKYDEFNGCGNCTKLKWNRKRLGLTQKEMADKIGVHVLTIGKLERDETAWATLQDSTVDKIMSFYSSMASWQPEKADTVIREINDETDTYEYEEQDTEDVSLEQSKCDILLNTRRTLGITQAELSVKVGVNEKTVRRLEKDESAWASVRESSVDKIMAFCSKVSSTKTEELDDTHEISIPKEEPIMKPEPVTKITPSNNGLSKQDEKTLTLIEFAYEELTQAKTHDDFVNAITMLRKIMNRY